jgi:hypothetical protein
MYHTAMNIPNVYEYTQWPWLYQMDITYLKNSFKASKNVQKMGVDVDTYMGIQSLETLY